MLQALRRRFGLDSHDARAIIERVFQDHPTHNFAVRLWDGHQIAWNDTRDFTLVFTDPETFRVCFASRDPARFAEAYVDGRLLVEGDLWAAAGVASYLRNLELGVRETLRLVPKLAVPTSAHSVDRDRRDVQAHYDLSDDLFRLFLDDKLVYSCAYFAYPHQRLELAQERKLDLICKKLDLRPDDRLLDIGCGWGALVIWAARRYGVRAHGITLSENQVAEARRRAADAGVADRVTVELGHYADLPAGRYDKVCSIGMYEHVGASRLPAYVRAVHRALRPGGLFLNHGITQPPRCPVRSGGAFIFRHVFPGAELAPVSRLQTVMEGTGFDILDVQAIGPHYALTLRQWFLRYMARRDDAARLVPARTLRAWDLYLAGCARAFEDGVLDVHQILASVPDPGGRLRPHFTREQMLLAAEVTPG